MIKALTENFSNIDKSIKKLMIKGIKFSLLVCLISSFILFTYEIFYNSPDLYYIGISVFKTGTIFASAFLGCGFAFNEIKKELG